MKTPDDIDAFLRGLLYESDGRPRHFSAEDKLLITRMLSAMEAGSTGVMIVQHEDRIEYLIANAGRRDGIGLMAEAISRNVDAARRDSRGRTD